MCTGKEYLELVSLFVQAKPPKSQELRPCHQHELLLQLLGRRKEPLTKGQLADLLWNVTSGPTKRKKSSKGRRQCGGMEQQQETEPTDIEVVFGCREKTPPSSIGHRGWGRSRIDATAHKKDKEEKPRSRRKLPSLWALMPFSCGWDLAHDASCQDVTHRKKR
nr:uncharacterized protein LOC108056178 isoform X2 [Drosophila takahashii]